MTKRLRKNKGFTLVEVTVSFVMLLILIALTTSVIMVGVNLFTNNAYLTNAQQSCDGVYDFLYKKIAYSENLTIKNGTDIPLPSGYADKKNRRFVLTKGGTELLSLSEGISSDVFSDSFMSSGRMLVSIENKTNYVILNIKVYENTIGEGNPLYSKEGIVPLLNYSEENKDNFAVSDCNNESNDLCIYMTYIV